MQQEFDINFSYAPGGDSKDDVEADIGARENEEIALPDGEIHNGSEERQSDMSLQIWRGIELNEHSLSRIEGVPFHFGTPSWELLIQS